MCVCTYPDNSHCNDDKRVLLTQASRSIIPLAWHMSGGRLVTCTTPHNKYVSHTYTPEMLKKRTRTRTHCKLLPGDMAFAIAVEVPPRLEPLPCSSSHIYCQKTHTHQTPKCKRYSTCRCPPETPFNVKCMVCTTPPPANNVDITRQQRCVMPVVNVCNIPKSIYMTYG